MKGNLRIWTWGYGQGGARNLRPVELEGMRDCTMEKAQTIISLLDPDRHWWIWIPPMDVKKAVRGGSTELRNRLRRSLGDGGEGVESGGEDGES